MQYQRYRTASRRVCFVSHYGDIIKMSSNYYHTGVFGSEWTSCYYVCNLLQAMRKSIVSRVQSVAYIEEEEEGGGGARSRLPFPLGPYLLEEFSEKSPKRSCFYVCTPPLFFVWSSPPSFWQSYIRHWVPWFRSFSLLNGDCAYLAELSEGFILLVITHPHISVGCLRKELLYLMTHIFDDALVLFRSVEMFDGSYATGNQHSSIVVSR